MKQGDIWYVTFGPDKADKTAESMVRSTRTFKSEVDAKLFAMQILSKGWTASAGTLNPISRNRSWDRRRSSAGPTRGLAAEIGFLHPGTIPA